MEGVFHPGLLLFHLGLCGGPHLDHGNAACQLGKSFLEFFAVIIRARFFDLGLDLRNPALNIAATAGAFNNSGVVFIDHHLFGLAEIRNSYTLKLATKVFGHHLSAGEGGEIFKH